MEFFCADLLLSKLIDINYNQSAIVREERYLHPEEQSMLKEESEQLVVHTSPYSVSETVEKLKKLLKEKNLTLFAFVDHSEEAHRVNLELQEEKLLIFGDPKVGTFLMQENPAIGIELPLKILIWKNQKGQTQIAYLDPIDLTTRYKMVKNQEIIKKMSKSLALLVNDVIK